MEERESITDSKNSLHFTKHEGSSSCSQQPVSVLYYIGHLHLNKSVTLWFQHSFHYYLPSMSRFSKWSLTSDFLPKFGTNLRPLLYVLHAKLISSSGYHPNNIQCTTNYEATRYLQQC